MRADMMFARAGSPISAATPARWMPSAMPRLYYRLGRLAPPNTSAGTETSGRDSGVNRTQIEAVPPSVVLPRRGIASLGWRGQVPSPSLRHRYEETDVEPAFGRCNRAGSPQKLPRSGHHFPGPFDTRAPT